jgi:hypothetical protein
MTNATFNIGKNLTVIFGGLVYQKNLSEVVVEAAKYDTVSLKGITKTEKLNKYLSKLETMGYKIISTDWRRENEIAEGAVDFQITLSK